MKIVVNENNIVTAYATIGSIPGSIGVNTLPADIEPMKYKYIGGEFVANPDYIAPNPTAIARIRELKGKLAETDYTVIKIAEGVATAAEYASVITQRQEWRAEINQLENPI